MSKTHAEILDLGQVPNPRVILASDKGYRPYFIEAGQFGAAAKTGDGVFLDEVQTVLNKTFGDGTKITLGSDATGDLYFRATAPGNLQRLPIGPEGHVLKSVAGIPTWSAGAALNNFIESRLAALDSGPADVVVLTPSGDVLSTKIDMMLEVGLNGSFMLLQNSTTLGNIRGAGAVDLQIFRSNPTQVASGAFSFIGGGFGNIASGAYSSASGRSATTRGVEGAEVRSSGMFDTIGDAQVGKYILRGATSDAFGVTLTTNGSGTAAANNIIQLPPDSIFSVRGHIVARGSNGSCLSKKFTTAVRRDGSASNVVITGTPSFTDVVTTGTAAAWVTAFAASITSPGFTLNVGGESGVNINWVAVIETVEVAL